MAFFPLLMLLDANGKVLEFQLEEGQLIGTQTHSTWNILGTCIEGELKGTQLKTIQAYQEYWHSWKTFHPNTEQYIE